MNLQRDFLHGFAPEAGQLYRQVQQLGEGRDVLVQRGNHLPIVLGDEVVVAGEARAQIAGHLPEDEQRPTLTVAPDDRAATDGVWIAAIARVRPKRRDLLRRPVADVDDSRIRLPPSKPGFRRRKPQVGVGHTREMFQMPLIGLSEVERIEETPVTAVVLLARLVVHGQVVTRRAPRHDRRQILDRRTILVR